MKIFIATRSFYPFNGGVERYISQIILQLYDLNHITSIFTPATDQVCPGSSIIKNLFKHKISKNLPLPSLIPFPNPQIKSFFFFLKPFKNEYLLFRMLKKIKQTPDLCIARFSSEALALKKRWPKTPLLYVIPSVGGLELKNDFYDSAEPLKDKFFSRLYKPFIDFQEKRALLAADSIICFSKNSMELTKKYHNLKNANFTISPPGIDVKNFVLRDTNDFDKINSLNPIILFAGRLKRVKGPDIALKSFFRAADILKHKNIFPLLIFAGNGPEKAGLKKLFLDELNRPGSALTENSVKFMGFIDDMAPLYKRASLLIHTSRLEFFGQVLIESMAWGTPVLSISKTKNHLVASNEIITDNVNGFLAKTGSFDCIGKKAAQILSNPDKLKKISENAKHMVIKKYSWKKHIQTLLDFCPEKIKFE
jgi:glycosyltransferase involved in cell wall biosynthesis